MGRSSAIEDHYLLIPLYKYFTKYRIEEREAKWIFCKANWGKFEYLCEVKSSEIDLNQDIEDIDDTFREVVLKAAYLSIPKREI